MVANLSSANHSNALFPCEKRPCDDVTYKDSVGFRLTNKSDGVYACTCDDRSLFPYCLRDVDECALDLHDCSVDSTCSNTPGGFECLLPPEQPRNCSVNICFNGGICLEQSGENKTCVCPANFTGLRCETSDDACWPSPCRNGTCTATADGIICSCSKGFTGIFCQTDIDECLVSPCARHSTCINGIGGYSCECANGYTGTSCDVDVDECASNPCNREACRDGVDSYSCVLVYEACKINLCQHSGLCIRTQGEDVCYYTNSYYGDRCEQEVDECLSHPCLNEASCQDGVANYTCVCSSGFTGHQCESEIACNTTTKCLNGGTCRGHLCLCVKGYTGRRCESQIDPCSSSPCQYGGTCAPDFPSYTCSCPSGTLGHDCDVFQYCTTTDHAVATPGRVFSSAVSKDSIRVSWHVDLQHEANSTDAISYSFVILGYLLEYSSAGGRFVRNTTANTTTKVIENLNYVPFQFRVAALGVLSDQLVCSKYSNALKPVYPKVSSE